MFKRRHPLTKLQLLKELFWPSMGWKRAVVFLRYRILRLSDSTHKIASGLACGGALSFTPLVGTHFIQAGIIAYWIRGNVLASMIGTFVGNPWTFPFMWYGAFRLGALLFGLMGFEEMGEIPEGFTFWMIWEMITTDPLNVIVPWMLGGYILALLSWPFFFVFFFYLVGAGKKARAMAKEKRLRRKIKKQFQEAEQE